MTFASVDASLTRKIVESLVVAIVCTGLSAIVAFGAGWITTINPIELLAVFTSYSCTYLCVVQSRWNYPIGMLSTILLSITFFQAGLYGSAALNAYLPFALAYGFWRWDKDVVTRPVTWLGFSGWWTGYAVITAGVFLAVYFVATSLGAQLPFWDGLIVAGSILAQMLLDNKRMETWIAWAVVNVIAICIYFSQELYFVALQFVFFLANAGWGFYKWKQNVVTEVPTINYGKWWAEEKIDIEQDQASA